jgi:hypothetical protein
MFVLVYLLLALSLNISEEHKEKMSDNRALRKRIFEPKKVRKLYDMLHNL